MSSRDNLTAEIADRLIYNAKNANYRWLFNGLKRVLNESHMSLKIRLPQDCGLSLWLLMVLCLALFQWKLYGILCWGAASNNPHWPMYKWQYQTIRNIVDAVNQDSNILWWALQHWVKARGPLRYKMTPNLNEFYQLLRESYDSIRHFVIVALLWVRSFSDYQRLPRS